MPGWEHAAQDAWVEVDVGPVERDGGSLEGVIEVYPGIVAGEGLALVMELKGYRTRNTIFVHGISGINPLNGDVTSLIGVITQPSYAERLRAEELSGEDDPRPKASVSDWWAAVETFRAFRTGRPAPKLRDS